MFLWLYTLLPCIRFPTYFIIFNVYTQLTNWSTVNSEWDFTTSIRASSVEKMCGDLVWSGQCNVINKKGKNKKHTSCMQTGRMSCSRNVGSASCCEPLCSLIFYFLWPLHPEHTLPTWLPQLFMTQCPKRWLSLKMKARLFFDAARRGCVTAEGGDVQGWLVFFDPTLSPLQLASLVGLQITRPRSIPIQTPSPRRFLPLYSCLTPDSLQAYHISYKGPNKYPQPLCGLPTITAASPLSSEAPETLTNTHI